MTLAVIAGCLVGACQSEHQNDIDPRPHTTGNVVDDATSNRSVISLARSNVRDGQVRRRFRIVVTKLKPTVRVVDLENWSTTRLHDGERAQTSTNLDRVLPTDPIQPWTEARIKIGTAHAVQQCDELIAVQVSHVPRVSRTEPVVLALGAGGDCSDGAQLNHRPDPERSSVLPHELPRDEVGRWRGRTNVFKCLDVNPGDADSRRRHPRDVVDHDAHGIR